MSCSAPPAYFYNGQHVWNNAGESEAYKKN